MVMFAVTANFTASREYWNSTSIFRFFLFFVFCTSYAIPPQIYSYRRSIPANMPSDRYRSIRYRPHRHQVLDPIRRHRHCPSEGHRLHRPSEYRHLLCPYGLSLFPAFSTLRWLACLRNRPRTSHRKALPPYDSSLSRAPVPQLRGRPYTCECTEMAYWPDSHGTVGRFPCSSKPCWGGY